MNDYDEVVQQVAAQIAEEGIQHFEAEELVRPHAGVPSLGACWRVMPTLRIADWLRDKLGEPLHVLSSYRSPEYNARVGGAENSLHLRFNALDLTAKGTPPAELAALLEQHRLAPLLGVGVYSTFIHLDTRGLLGIHTPARWR